MASFRIKNFDSCCCQQLKSYFLKMANHICTRPINDAIFCPNPPVLNNVQFVKKCISSLLILLYKSFEVTPHRKQ